MQQKANPIAGHVQGGAAAEAQRIVRSALRRLEVLNDPQGIYAIMPVSIEIR
jgi:hypothetical protein